MRSESVSPAVVSRGSSLLLAVAASFAFSSSLFFGFTAEDAYILFRYVANIHSLGDWVYNAGERINSLTSPLHGMTMALLYTFTRESVLTGKLLGLCLTVASAVMLARRYRNESALAALVLSVAILPTSVVLWTFGGLETPLLACLVAVGSLGITRIPMAGALTCCAVAGLGFLARYDAALFFAPLALAALVHEPSWRRRIVAATAGGLGPALWLAFAWWHFGDVFPTSFYIKAPKLDAATIHRNAVYVGSWLIFTGALPAALVCAPRARSVRERLGSMTLAQWALFAGILAELLYAFTIATTHMMFSFRSFTAYLPAVAVFVAEGMGGAGAAPRLEAGQRRVIAAFVVVACGFQAAHAWVTYTRSMNGLSPVGEFRRVGTRDFMDGFMEGLWTQAGVIRADWPRRAASGMRPMRLATYVGGVVPFALPDAYVFELLASYRHHSFRYWNWSEYADYTMVLTPFFGLPDQQLIGGPSHYELIFERPVLLNGEPQRFQLYYNPAPSPLPLGDRIDRCCRPPS